MAHFDTNRNGSIDYNEFIGAVYGIMSEVKRNKIQSVFSKFDKGGSGKINAVDLKIAFNSA